MIVGSEQDGHGERRAAAVRRAAQSRRRTPSAPVPGRVSSWLTRFAESPTSTRAETRAGAPERPERDPDELQRAGRRAGAEVRAKAALGAAPEVVREPERRDRRDRRHREPDDRADERQAQPAEAPRCGAHVASSRSRSWRPRCDEAARGRGPSRGARGRARSPRRRRPARAASIVIRVSTPKPGRDGKELRAGRAREAALAGERLADAEPASRRDERARRPTSQSRGRRPRGARRLRSRGRRRRRRERP